MKKENVLGWLVVIQLLTTLYYLPSSYKYFVNLLDQNLFDSFDGIFMLLIRYGFSVIAGVGLYQFWQNQNIFNPWLKAYFIFDLFLYGIEVPRLIFFLFQDGTTIDFKFAFFFFQILSFLTCLIVILIFSKEKIQVVGTPSGKRRIRFLHLFIDWIIILIVTAQSFDYISYSTYGMSSGYEGLLSYIIIPYIVPTVYYFISEGIFQQTIGKVVTNKYVRKINGQRASAGSILGRTLARFIPFEAFSYFSTPPNGWHDSLSKTNVYERSEGFEADIIEHLILDD